jgi:Ca2+/H+ antiporter, TMEM165/GDT1 family
MSLVKSLADWLRFIKLAQVDANCPGEELDMLTAFTAGLSLIAVSELLDKTFFIAAILATRHPRRWVFLGAIMALAAMTVISVLFGQIAGLLPQTYVKWAEFLLFLSFGLKLLYDASRMDKSACEHEQAEALEVVKRTQAKLPKRKVQRPAAVIVEAFSLTFVAEWGDRTQFATIALAAANHPVGVAIGAILGHALCAAIAVVCGRVICRYISERAITALGGGLFLVFAVVGLFKLSLVQT